MTRRELFRDNIGMKNACDYKDKTGLLNTWFNPGDAVRGLSMFCFKPHNDIDDFHRITGQFKDDGYTK